VVAAQLYLAEPPATYLIKPPLVVDASAVCGLLFDEAWRGDAAAAMTGRSLHAPSLLRYEVASVGLKKQRAGWPTESVLLGFEDFVQMDLTLHSVDIREQLHLATKYGLSTYDAAYLWLSDHLKCPLITFDQALGKAAALHLGNL
jgi:predicted nucleic acid-binding protein